MPRAITRPAAYYGSKALLPAGWQCVRAAPTRVSSSRAKTLRTECVWLNPAAVAANERRQASLWASASGEGVSA